LAADQGRWDPMSWEGAHAWDSYHQLQPWEEGESGHVPSSVSLVATPPSSFAEDAVDASTELEACWFDVKVGPVIDMHAV
jgi:hypothetical protein